MIQTHFPIYLASSSPRRRKLLKQLGFDFTTFSVDVEETLLNDETPQEAVQRLAEEKLNEAVKKVSDGIIITADTLVVLNNTILGKPKDQNEAKEMLRTLSGNTHTVFTGFAIFNSPENRKIVDYEETRVTFYDLTENEIVNYVGTGSPLDKAGSYGIQDDIGAAFIKRIEGCYYNVVGLPLAKVYHSLLKVLSIDR